jgi:hypothetical protein
MWKRLVELAVEIEKLAPPTGRQGWHYIYACQAADAIAALREALEREQGYRREGEERRRR